VKRDLRSDGVRYLRFDNAVVRALSRIAGGYDYAGRYVIGDEISDRRRRAKFRPLPID
jgi:hypothetical protein